MDLDINKILQSACKTNNKLIKKIVYWFCKHYFCCDIHPNTNIEGVTFAHNALGVVINENAKIEEGTLIQHHVTVGRNNKGTPYICSGVLIGAHAIVIGDIKIGKNATIGAGAVVTKNVEAGATVVGNPARVVNGECNV